MRLSTINDCLCGFRRIARLRDASKFTVVEAGDWLCAICGHTNWADRRECRK